MINRLFPGAGGDTPGLYQPEPLHTFAGRFSVGPVAITAITRVWAEGDCQRCRLCPQCTAVLNVCAIQTGNHVPTGEAALYRFDTVGPGRRRTEGGGR